MRLNILLATAIAAAVSINASCSTCNTGPDRSTSSHAGSGNTVTRTLSLKNFHGISSSRAVEVYYTQGSRYKVVVEGRKETIDESIIKVTDGVLTISDRNRNHTGGINMIDRSGILKRKNDFPHLILRITAPRIEYIKNDDSAMTFTAGTMTTSDLHIDSSGSLKIKVDKVNGDDISIENSGSLSFKGDISATSVKFDNSGASNIRSSIKARNRVYYDGSGSTSSDLKVSAKAVTIDCSGTFSGHLDISSDRLDMDMSGTANCNVTFNGGDADVDIAGTGNMQMTLDCKSINVDAGGMAKVRLEGTADHTEFNSSGTARLNTSDLNKF